MRNLVSSKGNPTPQGAEAREVIASDGIGLRLALFPATVPTPRGAILIVPGRTECIEKYFETVEDLRVRGFSVAVHDPRGQGRSDRLVPGQLGHIDDYADFVRDVEAVVPVVKAAFAGPLVLVGHSMGGHIVLRTVLKHPKIADRIALSSPFLGFGSGFKLPRSLIGILAQVLSFLGFYRQAVPGSETDVTKLTPFERNELTHDPQRYERWLNIQHAAKDLITGSPTVGWVRASVQSMELIETEGALEGISLPVLITAAAEDTIAQPKAVADAGRRISNAHYVSLKGSRHEALQELDPIRKEWLALFDQFVADLG